MKITRETPSVAYERWQAERRLALHDAKKAREWLASESLDCGNLLKLGLKGAAAVVESERSRLEYLVNAATEDAKSVSYPMLLSWCGPRAQLEHIATRCRAAAHDFMADNGEFDLSYEIARLFQKKTSHLTKFELVCGHNNDGVLYGWCEKNGVAIDASKDPVYVVPKELYPVTHRLGLADRPEPTWEYVTAMESYFTCEKFAKRNGPRSTG